jgi:heme-degrading monooxygenase HmoA
MKSKAKPGFIIVWEFRVRSRKRREFEQAYGTKGVWARFFRSGKGYIQTELIRSIGTPGRYLTLDLWTSSQAYQRFKKENRVEYRVLDKRCESLTERETEVGGFKSIGAVQRNLRKPT